MTKENDPSVGHRPMPEMGMLEIVRMVKGQLDREFDSYRMMTFWQRLLDSPTDKKVIAQALCCVLSSGEYVKKSQQAQAVFNVTVTAQGPSGEIAKALAAELEKAQGR